MMKRLLSGLLAVAMILSLLPKRTIATVVSFAGQNETSQQEDVLLESLSVPIPVLPGQLVGDTGEIVENEIYGYVVGYPLKKGHTLSIGNTDYVFSVRQYQDGNYSTMLKQATTNSFTATEDMTVGCLIRKPDKSTLTTEELASVMLYDTIYGMKGVNGLVHRFTVEAETIDGGTAATRAAIFLPESYSDSGKPTRLVVMTNGYSAHLTNSIWNKNSTENVQVIQNYLNADYAVWVVDNTAASTSQTPDLGCPQLVDSYFKAYEYIQSNLNVEQKFSVHARSFGTFAAIRMMREHPELVKCAVMTGSRVSIKAQWPGINKTHVANRFGFTDTTGATYEADKLVGYDPYTDVNDATYALPPTFWMLAEGDSTEKPCEFIEKLTAHGNDVTWKIYSDISHTGICTLNTDETFADALAFLEKNYGLEGKKISILGASISTYTGISNNAGDNATIGDNAVYYTAGRHGVYAEDTWWMQAVNDLGLELLVNNSWSGSSLLYERSGTVGAYVDRCVQLHNNDGEEPDMIAIQMGTNDFQYYKDTLGTADIDYEVLIVANGEGGYTYAEPTTSLEAAAIVLHKISVRYPDAEVYYLNISQRVDGTDELIQSFNAELKKVVEHFGAHIVDIYGSVITMDRFDTYIGDGRVHPNKLGMDAYTEAFKEAVTANTNYRIDTHTVTFDLNGVTADYGDDKIVVSGDAFSVKLTAADSLRVTVTMGGEDITASAYSNGTVSIDAVTADVTIAAFSVHETQNYRWEFDGTDLTSVSGNNALTKNGGTTTDGVFTGTRYALEKTVILQHDLPWTVEWKCAGTFMNSGGSTGARIFTSDDVNANYNARYIFKSNKNGLIAMGEKTSTGSHNYGIALGDYGIDWTAEHIYRLENRIAADGSNMVYLLVDGVEIGAMNRYYVGTTDKKTTSDWLSGKDFVFPYMGTDTHGFTNATIEYIQVTECNHTYENGVCTICGTAASPYLQQLPENIIGCTNLYDVLTPVKGYYTATKYDTTNGAVLSVVIPVEPGDRIAASSFASISENMGAVDGIRVTYLLGDKIVSSLSAGEVYGKYISDGYITVPEGVDAVCIPWWKPSDNNWMTLLQISKDFAVHSPKTVSAQAPTCTKIGYTAGEICEICHASLSGREEIAPIGHVYSSGFCTVCGAVGLSAILGGKYVSILGDSISTFNGYSNDASVNTTIGGNGPRYDVGTADTKPGSYCLLESVDDTWWMNFANRTGMELLVNNSWAGSQVFGGQTSDGRVIPAAYLERCVNLHDNTLKNNLGNAPIDPDVIFVYLGINDYNFNRGHVGSGEVDYASLVNSDGSYVTPANFGEAYAIMLDKMQKAYPNAQIFVMTLLPENLYSVDKTAWEQHNAYIRAAAAYYGIPVVDLAENCAITWENFSGYMIDRIHPTSAGMELIADCIEGELQSYYTENPPHTHSYESTVTAPTCTEGGYTTHTCTGCGASYTSDHTEALGHSYANGICAGCGSEHPNLADYKGKVISILSASTSTFAGWIPTADGFNLEHRARYPQDNLFTDVESTWWHQLITQLGAKLGINDSWAGSQVLNTLDTNSGDLGPDACMASLTRIQNLGANGTPDLILFFGAGNDMGRGVTLGSFDPATAPEEVDLTTTKWDTLADAYVAAIMRLQYFYPDAEIVVMTTYAMPSYVTNAKLDKYGPVLKAICDHYGVKTVDLRNSGVTFDMLPDNIHPNAEGMDYITEYVMQSLLNDVDMEAGEHTVYTVTHEMSNASADLHYYKGVSAGKSFVETVYGDNVTVTVTMGGVDITASVYADGVISIPAVTGDVVITAKASFNADGHLQQLPDNLCAGTNLWTALEPENIYYTASGWGNTSAGTTWSITFPVNPGDRIWATSLGAYPGNGSSANGVRVTWFDENGVLISLDRNTVYAEFAQYGYITAPEGAVALNLPMTYNVDGYAVYILSAEHSYETVVTDPTCTEQGYTTHTCTNCGDSYVDTYTDALGHCYENGACADCGAVLGDLDLDGDVDAQDLTILARHVAGIEVLVDKTALANADVDGDGDVDADDLTIHARFVAGIISAFPEKSGAP